MNIPKRLVAVAALAGVAAFPTAAMADPGDSADVDVTVQIAPIVEPGVLALTVAANAATLTENGSTLLVRQFTGTLPTVTVTDTRTADEIPAGSSWAVLGSSSDFTGTAGQAPITADHLGWKPRLVDGGNSDGQVSEGEEVVTSLDQPTQPGNNVGLTDQELLVSTYDSASVTGDAYSVNADLFLRTPADVSAGSYQAKLTLSLFE
ncbi:hypothetical protein BJ973_004382 [Actinoplanes tereljensis]|uniref:WxL domain-containing protein n=1 Tax=Paractinoplanes tereljensis TaxID=571912 RepID=A0A919NTK9_9ACTN|nr:hypothetical protein [Actinoplanes tereljensis]GIF23771.1 hypothetical protein Ate02nite_65010 [Actinoplanes tereljensis]